MTGLDSIYAMLARPHRLQRMDNTPKRKVGGVNEDTSISANTKEAPQSRQAPTKHKHNDITDDDAPLPTKAPTHRIDVEI
ncbi:hypothetical protein ACFOD0_15750 [Shewanella intestini]|uniref:Uncharacterized protein n=1 Tax=Shewanella intestini TaxID=2017544 RepID=A0ABS5I4W5_9GAMM|nr:MULTISPECIES: hypothetical protein [Shewanella]MBR9729056.1 hypothetical protein [Shewanella intestini]MRG37132.1 hypothetical protein [Shewanella sp. XMDDZSB0408]